MKARHGVLIRLMQAGTGIKSGSRATQQKKKFSILAAGETFDKNYKQLKIIVRGADRVLGPSMSRSRKSRKEREKAQRKQ